MKRTWFIIAMVMILAASVAAFAQQPSVGNLSGKVVDNEGKPLPGATVTVDGPLGSKAFQTDADGKFEYRAIPSGTYKVKVEMAGFQPILFSKVGVSAGQTTPLSIKLAAGRTEEVTVTSATPLVDVKRVEVNTTFKTDQAINTMPIGRNFVAAVSLAPGVVNATGTGNVSISGSSGLENSYVIDGINITSSGYGGVGTYSNAYGSLGTSITSDFLEEVQVKTGGFEAEYGQALGGVVTGTVKSGTNDLKGRVAVYYSPRSLEAYGSDPNLIGGSSNIHNEQTMDIGLQAGGPIVKDRIFWFAAYNPTKNWNDLVVVSDDPTNPLFNADPATRPVYPNALTTPAALGSGVRGDRKADNYAVKLNAVLTANHRLEATFFGDPSKGYGGRGSLTSAPFVLGAYDAAGTPLPELTKTAAAYGVGQTSTIKWGADQQSLKYNGFFGGEWFLEGQFSNRKNTFEETLGVNDYAYSDRRVQLLTGGGPRLRSGGIGYYAPISDKTKDYSLKLSKTFGGHEVKVGGEYWDLKYSEKAKYSGAPFVAHLPNVVVGGPDIDVETVTGASVDVRGGFGAGNCDPTNPIYVANCEAAPYYRVVRTRFNDPGETSAREINFFAQDTWSLSDKFTLKLGVRSQDQKLQGSQSFTLPFTYAGGGRFTADPTTYNPQTYQFKREFSPRIGLSFDPAANGKSKIYLNYARYFERVPSDLAVRAFSNEVGLSSYETRDPYLTIRRGAGNVRQQGVFPTQVESGTRLPYKDEYVLGWQQLLRPDLSVEVRGIYRKQGRVLEDTQNITVEEIQNTYYGVNSYYGVNGGYGGPVTVDPFPNYPTGNGFGAYVLANPGQNTGGGFGTPELKYKALELQIEKRLADNWQGFMNYRFSSLKGNYEGLFRTDNGQSDPNITSLFDFPNSHLMRGQFQPGFLSNDRPHVFHAGGTYFFKNGIEVGGIFNWQSGTPRTPLLAHPNYQNAGELPGRNPIYTYWDPALGEGGDWARSSTCSTNPGVTNCFLYDYTDSPRGSNGRTADTSTIDIHMGYGKDFRGMRLKLAFDITNLFNNQEATAFDDNVEQTASIADPNYLRATGYEQPRQVRLSVLWDW